MKYPVVKRITMISLLVWIMIILVACAGMEGVKSFDKMTSKEKATWMMGIYNSQARDYKSMVARPNLTNVQKDILRTKKAVLTEVWPLINTYTAFINSGVDPTRAVEDRIIGLINDLTAIALPLMEGG